MPFTNRKIVGVEYVGKSGYQSYIDASFVVGDSPATIDVNTDLGYNSNDGHIICDGAGNISVTLNSGSGVGDAIILKSGETFDLEGIEVDTIVITHVADSAYRVFVK